MTGPRRWPLFLIAAPAAVSIWSGWVGLGGMSGFGKVHPLPGIADGFVLNTAITLPVGVEAYGAYALGAWLSLPAGHPARGFAKRSAIGSLVLGMLGQVAYHLLAAAHALRAPWPVVVAVACMPVVTLGFGAALTHLLRSAPAGGSPDLTAAAADLAGELAAALGALGGELRTALAVPEPSRPAVVLRDASPQVLDDVSAAPGGDVSRVATLDGSAAALVGEPGLDRLAAWLTGAGTRVPEPPAALNGHAHQAAELFAADLAAGQVPGIRAIRAGLQVGQDRAQLVQAYLRELAAAPRHRI